jgi:hypothetical protein
VKYVNQEDADHLIKAIQKYYPMTVDTEATKYIGDYLIMSESYLIVTSQTSWERI